MAGEPLSALWDFRDVISSFRETPVEAPRLLQFLVAATCSEITSNLRDGGQETLYLALESRPQSQATSTASSLANCHRSDSRRVSYCTTWGFEPVRPNLRSYEPEYSHFSSCLGHEAGAPLPTSTRPSTISASTSALLGRGYSLFDS